METRSLCLLYYQSVPNLIADHGVRDEIEILVVVVSHGTDVLTRGQDQGLDHAHHDTDEDKSVYDTTIFGACQEHANVMLPFRLHKGAFKFNTCKGDPADRLSATEIG